MSDSIRQQIITALDTRLRTITVVNGYKTNAGANVFDWLDRDLADTELDAIVYRDKTAPIDKATLSEYNHRVQVEIEPRSKAATATAARIREINEDVFKAIGTDDTFGGLAIDTQPMGEDMDIRQSEKIMGSAMLNIEIEYSTAKWQY